MDKGFLKLPRGLRDSFDNCNKKDFQRWLVYVVLFDRANWADGDEIKRGQLVITSTELERLCCVLSIETIRRVMRWLKINKYILTQPFSKWNNKGLLVTLTRYDNHPENPILYDIKSTDKRRTNAGHDEKNRRTNAGQPIALSLDNLPFSPDKRRTQEMESTDKRRTNAAPISKELRIKEKKNTTTSTPGVDKAPSEHQCNDIDLALVWNQKLPNHRQNDVALLSKNQKRQKVIKAAIDLIGFDKLVSAIDMISASPFLCGSNDRRWKPEFVWLMNTENAQKVLEGKYCCLKTDDKTVSKIVNFTDITISGQKDGPKNQENRNGFTREMLER